MFDISWTEMLVVVAVAVLVIGPKDIPKILYQVGRFFRRFQYVKFAMSRQFDEILRAGDIEELRKGVNFEVKADKPATQEQKDASAQAERDADEELAAPPEPVDVRAEEKNP